MYESSPQNRPGSLPENNSRLSHLAKLGRFIGRILNHRAVEAYPHEHTQTMEEFKEAVRNIQGPYVHVLIFRFRDEAPDDAVAKSIDMVTELGKLPGITSWNVQKSIDQRKGRTVIEAGVFENGQSFLDFRDMPQHQEFARYVRNYADWNIVDFAGDNAIIPAAIDQ